MSSLNTISESKLLLHGGTIDESDCKTWILDLHSQSWTQYGSIEDNSKSLMNHTGTTGLNNCVIMISGLNCNDNTFSLRLEPKSLQQLAAQTIAKHQTFVQYLPNKLISQLGF